MRDRRRKWGLCLALAGISSTAEAQLPTPPALEASAPAARLGVVRVRIDPTIGEQDAEIRKLLGAFPFVQVAEPADYLITTNPDFPLDLALYDLQQPPTIWQHQYPEDHQTLGDEPRHFAIGNLADPQTADRLATTLTAAARIRAVLDRSLASMQGVEACVVIAEPTGDAAQKPPECVSMDQLGSRKIVISDWVSAIRVRNASTGDRYVAIAAADVNFMFGSAASDVATRVVKLAPGQSAEFNTNIAIYYFSRDPRVFILASARPFGVDQLAQPAPLDPDKECEDLTAPGCQPNLSPVALNDDLAVRSIQLHVIPEPQPAMGGGSDVTARMAVWMAQFYSVIPFTPAEIAADAKLPDDKTQFLARRSYEERQHRCGAALIGPNLVLTAAHCLAKDQYAGDGLAKVLKQRRVRLGSRKIGQGGQTFAIDGVAVHANYDPERQNHDIALLLLKPDRASGSARPTPIAVADKPLPGGVNALGFGWGLTGAVAPNGNIMLTLDARMQGNADVLQYGEMRSVSLNECKKKFRAEVAPGMVCMYSKTALAGGLSADGVFTCRGDSGGPLVRKIGDRDVLVGVVSWSKGCGYKDYPSVFTDAGSYAAWIAAARAQLKPGTAIRPKDPARPR